MCSRVRTAELYRARLPSVLIVQLRISVGEARRRAALRPVYLTDDEFELLHRQQPSDAELYDDVVEVDGLDLAAQVAAVRGQSGPDTRAGLSTRCHRGVTDGRLAGRGSHRMSPRSHGRRWSCAN